MWIYSQLTGIIRNDKTGKQFKGYSGTKAGRNNPVMQNVPNVGPIPRGTYSIAPARLSQRLGPLTMDLEPTPTTNTFGRSLFRIHGNNAIDDASHGCIILDHEARTYINGQTDRVLEVTE